MWWVIVIALGVEDACVSELDLGLVLWMSRAVSGSPRPCYVWIESLALPDTFSESLVTVDSCWTAIFLLGRVLSPCSSSGRIMNRPLGWRRSSVLGVGCRSAR